MKKRTLLMSALALATAAATRSGAAHAQDFPPKKPITLVVGFAAGGAGGNIAHQFVANAPADGSVLLLGSVGPLTIAPHLMKVNYDPFKDLAAVSGGVNFPNVLVVHKGAGVKTLAEFVQLSKKKPGSVDFASTGAGSASHLAGELFNQRAGIDMTHVPEEPVSGPSGDRVGAQSG